MPVSHAICLNSKPVIFNSSRRDNVWLVANTILGQFYINELTLPWIRWVALLWLWKYTSTKRESPTLLYLKNYTTNFHQTLWHTNGKQSSSYSSLHREPFYFSNLWSWKDTKKSARLESSPSKTLELPDGQSSAGPLLILKLIFSRQVPWDGKVGDGFIAKIHLIPWKAWIEQDRKRASSWDCIRSQPTTCPPRCLLFFGEGFAEACLLYLSMFIHPDF